MVQKNEVVIEGDTFIVEWEIGPIFPVVHKIRAIDGMELCLMSAFTVSEREDLSKQLRGLNAVRS